MSANRKPIGGGGHRHPRSLANLRRGGPITPANALRHGGHATARVLPVDGKARAIYALLAEEAPLRDQAGGLPAADRTAVELLALCLARLESIARYVELHGLLAEDGEVRPCVELERRLRVEAAGHCADLGLTPRARVVLGLQLQRGLSLAELMVEDAELERREREAGGSSDVDVIEGDVGVDG